LEQQEPIRLDSFQKVVLLQYSQAVKAAIHSRKALPRVGKSWLIHSGA
jgi:hypothetical protein